MISWGRPKAKTKDLRLSSMVVIVSACEFCVPAGFGVAAMVLKMGPSGGISGQTFQDTPYVPAAGLAGLGLGWGDAMTAITLDWNKPGVAQIAYAGTDSHTNSTYIDLRFKRIVKIMGYSGWWSGFTVVKSLLFQFSDGTNTGWIGAWGSTPPFFTAPALPFEYDVPLGFGLIGFFGNTGAVLDQIGFKFDVLVE